MSGDLISRRRLLEILNYNKAIHEDESGETRQLIAIDINKMIEYVEKMPVAYDVDKVVEQIDSISVERADYSESVECNISERGCISSCYECIKNHVEMIVKAGGVK